VSVRALRTPSYRMHKPTGRAVVTLDGRDFYLGKFGSPESQGEYDRLVAEWLANGRTLARRNSANGSDISVNELHLAFVEWAESYYRKGGRVTGEVTNIAYAVRTLRELYGLTLARDFGPVQLETVRQAIIKTGICRNEVNRRVRIIVRAFKWAVAKGMVPPSVHHGLQAVSGLRRGRCEVRETEPVRPVPEAFVDAVRPYVSRRVWTMIELQRLTGMRPGEVCMMRTIDVDTSGRVWSYTPESHKTEHHGRERKIYVGPAAQEILRPWLRPELTAYLFSPAESVAERRAKQRERRKSRVQPSQQNRRKRRPRKAPGAKYTTDSYRQAIDYAITTANRKIEQVGGTAIPHWHPNQLRHNAATRLRREFGLDVARAVLGHSSPVVTEVYAELDGAKAAEAMERVG
jgi:integrase